MSTRYLYPIVAISVTDGRGKRDLVRYVGIIRTDLPESAHLEAGHVPLHRADPAQVWQIRKWYRVGSDTPALMRRFGMEYHR